MLEFRKVKSNGMNSSFQPVEVKVYNDLSIWNHGNGSFLELRELLVRS